MHTQFSQKVRNMTVNLVVLVVAGEAGVGDSLDEMGDKIAERGGIAHNCHRNLVNSRTGAY